MFQQIPLLLLCHCIITKLQYVKYIEAKDSWKVIKI